MTREETLKKAIEIYGIDSQVDKMIESMSELTKALLKLRRTERAGDSYNLADMAVTWEKRDIREEMANVSIALDQMKIVYDSAEKCKLSMWNAETLSVAQWEQVQLKRLEERLWMAEN